MKIATKTNKQLQKPQTNNLHPQATRSLTRQRKSERQQQSRACPHCVTLTCVRLCNQNRLTSGTHVYARWFYKQPSQDQDINDVRRVVRAYNETSKAPRVKELFVKKLLQTFTAGD